MPYFKYLLENAFESVTKEAKAYALKQKGTEAHNQFASDQTNLMDDAITAILQIELKDNDWGTYKSELDDTLRKVHLQAEKKLARSSERDLDLLYFDRFSTGITAIYEELETLFKSPALAKHKDEDHSKYISNPPLYKMFLHVCLLYRVEKIIEYKVTVDDKSPTHTTSDKFKNLLLTLEAWHKELSQHETAPKGREAEVFSKTIKAIINDFLKQEDALQYQERKGIFQSFARRGVTFLGQKLGFQIGGRLGELLKPFLSKYNAMEQYQWEALPQPEPIVTHDEEEDEYYASGSLPHTPTSP